MSVFAAAAEIPAGERAAFVARACGTDAALREEVQSLLAAYDEAADFLEAPAAMGVDSKAPDLAARLQAALGGAFRVERELAGGGMSRVFVAEETRLGRRVVVKVLPPELREGLSIERFRRETRLAAALRHPHIVPLLSAGESPDGLVYFTMPFIEGESLQHRLAREGRLPLAEVVAIVHEVADALAYAHANGVIHRDVKPANVLIDGGHVIVADFGVAKALALARGERDRTGGAHRAYDPSTALTVAGFAIGTPAYMSPEQAKGEDVDARTDVYSLGCMTFEMLTGDVPLGDAGVFGTTPLGSKPAPAPCALFPGLPPAVDDVVARALAFDVDDRFQSTTELAEALGAAASTVSQGSGGEPRVHPTRAAWWRRWFAAAAVAAAAGAVGWVVVLRRPPVSSPSAAATGVAAANAGPRGAIPEAGAGSSNTTAPAAASGPGLAVLPFENVGRAADAYFAEGVGDELASRLTSLTGMRVISPGSTRQYRNSTKSRSQIGQELGVDYLLDGRVRWDSAGGAERRVRVSVELVRARDGSSVWADRYEPKTEDLFAVEGTIGERVATALEVALEEPARRTISARPTASFEAYTYFLRGEALRTTPEAAGGGWLRAVDLYERAVALDPRFALAFARLSQTHNETYWTYADRTAKRLALARGTAETALRLDPDLPEAHLALGLYYYRAQGDYDRALDEFTAALQRQPGRGELLAARGYVLRRQGRFAEAAASLTRAVELDPRSQQAALDLAWTYAPMRAYPEAVRYLERAIALSPRWTGAYADLALLLVIWRGDVEAARRVVHEGLAFPDAGQIMNRLRFHAAMFVGSDSADRAVVQRLTVDMFRGDTAEYFLWTADWTRRHGEASRARAYADSARTMLERRVRREPGEHGLRMALALAYAKLGRKADALREGEKAVALLPVSRDAMDGPGALEELAYVEMLVGETDSAIGRLAYLLTIPSTVSVPLLRADPMWDPLRGNARFQRLLATPTQ